MRICLIGFGEAGAMLADELAPRAALSAWDIQFPQRDSKPARAARERQLHARASAKEAVDSADLVISAVTAAQTLHAAREAAAHIKQGAFFLDLNSASPRAKIAAGAAIEAAGARYVEAAVMAPVAPKRLATPMLLGGPHAEDFAPIAARLGFSNARFYGAELGRAAAAKLCRSVVVKGMEALLLESMLAARHYGVEDDVARSLGDLFPGVDWRAHAAYMISRAIEHGARRAEEMHEAARTVADAGLAPQMSEACAARQAWAARTFASVRQEELAMMLDAMQEKI